MGVLDATPQAFQGLSQIKPLKDFRESITPETRSLFFQRQTALGDVLMLIPVVKEIKKEFPELSMKLFTQMDNDIVRHFGSGVFDEILRYPRGLENRDSSRVIFILDGVVEKDILYPKYQVKHRIDIYREWFGLEENLEPDWGEEGYIGSGDFVFCWQGSRALKTLSLEARDFVIERLERKYGRKVTLIDESKKLSPMEVIEAIKQAPVIVTVDSAPLWIAHFTKTPTVFLHGPSRPNERLKYHPLRPEGVFSVNMAEMVGCSFCFERMSRCRGSAECMKPDPQALWKKIDEGVERVRWKKK